MSEDSFDSLKSKTVSSLAWKLLERFGNQGIMLLVTIVMARLLTPDEYGALAIMMVFVTLGGVFVQSGLNTALIQNPETAEDDYSTVFWLSMGIAVVVYAVVCVSAPFVESFYLMPGLASPLRVVGLVLFVNAFNSVQVAKVTRELRLKSVFFATLASAVVSGVAGISSAVAGLGIWALVIQQLSYQFVNCVVLCAQVAWFPRIVFDFKRAKSLLSFGYKLLVSSLVNVAYVNISDLIIGKVFDAHVLGLVSRGKSWSLTLANALDGSIQSVMLSAVSKIQDDKAMVKRLTRRALKTSAFLTFPVMSALAACAYPLVVLLIGEQWVESVQFVQMYCFINALRVVETSNLQSLNGIGRSDLFLKLEIIKTIPGFAVLLFTAFVLRDIYAIVVGYMLMRVFDALVDAIPVHRIIGYTVREQLLDIGPIAIASIISIALSSIVAALSLPLLATLIIQLMVFTASYFGLALVMKLEAFRYLQTMARELISRRRAL